jgi:hypothetical protein
LDEKNLRHRLSIGRHFFFLVRSGGVKPEGVRGNPVSPAAEDCFVAVAPRNDSWGDDSWGDDNGAYAGVPSG